MSVPLGATLVWYGIVRGSYKNAERIMIVLSLIYFTYPVSAFLAKPDWHDALRQTIIPELRTDAEYITMIVGLIGTTITPWMQFYLQASIVEKGISARDYVLAKWDVIIGCIITDVIAFFIVVACGATLYHSGHRDINDAAEAAVALRPFAGQFSSAKTRNNCRNRKRTVSLPPGRSLPL